MRCRQREEDGKTRETGVEGGEGRERERKESARDFGKPIGVSIREGVSIRSVSIREGPLYRLACSDTARRLPSHYAEHAA